MLSARLPLKTKISHILNFKRAIVAAVLLAGVAVSLLLVDSRQQSPDTDTVQSHGDFITVSQLPLEGQRVYALILQGGPFKFDKDGTVFGNRERLLPANTRGFYKEYTVTTPGVAHRGARRLVCGGKQVVSLLCYYTNNHYASFRLVVSE
ncbi:MAG: ribonuclease T1 [Burkholderiaceae bacterium]|jgi:ribonuclease T1